MKEPVTKVYAIPQERWNISVTPMPSLTLSEPRLVAEEREIGVSLATPDKIRRLQRALYVTAKHAPARRFHALYDKV